MKNPELVARLIELQSIWYFPIIFISTCLIIISIYYLYKIKKNSDYILKMRTYEFEKNNPEKTLNDLINDRYGYYKVKYK